MEAEATANPCVNELRFRAMGTSCHVLITGPGGAALARAAQHRINELEGRWSRFKPFSEINQLNTNGELAVSPETFSLIEHAHLAHQATNGIWNPLMGKRMVELGYDRPFTCGLAGEQRLHAKTAPTADQLVVDPSHHTVELPLGAALDVGGIAKGFAADLVSAEMMAAGAWGTLINLGGDLRVRGLPPCGLDWTIEIGGPTADDVQVSIIALTQGAVATSTTARRRWSGPTGERHHLLDPRTSLPAKTDTAVTSAVAGEAWWAEVAATALTIDPDLTLPGIAALQQGCDGTTTRINDFERYER